MKAMLFSLAAVIGLTVGVGSASAQGYGYGGPHGHRHYHGGYYGGPVYRPVPVYRPYSYYPAPVYVAPRPYYYGGGYNGYYGSGISVGVYGPRGGFTYYGR